MEDEVTLQHAQRRLASLWLALAITTALLMGWAANVQNVFESNGKSLGEQAFQWFTPTVAPTAGLILGVLASVELNNKYAAEIRKRRVTRFFYRLTFGVCTVYLLLVFAITLLACGRDSGDASMAFLRSWNNMLSMLQGFVSVVLGVFFVASKPEAPQSDVVKATLPAKWTFEAAAGTVAQIAGSRAEFKGFDAAALKALLGKECHVQGPSAEVALQELGKQVPAAVPGYSVTHDAATNVCVLTAAVGPH